MRSAGLLLNYASQSAYCQQSGSSGVAQVSSCIATHGSCDTASRTDVTYRRHYVGGCRASEPCGLRLNASNF